MSYEREPLVNLGGLWINKNNENKTGPVLKGYLGHAQLQVWKNKWKEKDNPDHVNYPDFNITISNKPKKIEGEQETREDDDVPF